MDASDKKIGTPVDKILLFCYHYDPATGKYGPMVMNIVRLGAVGNGVYAGPVHVRVAAARAEGLVKMPGNFTLFPDQAAAGAVEVDHLYYFLIAVSLVMTVGIFLAIAIFAIKYRRRSPTEIPKQIEGSMRLEIAWSVIPFLIMLVMFGWGAKIFFDEYAGAPKNAYSIYVVGKQWMWKVQYPEGNREINELHVPVGRPVKITLASEDVIHSFFIPAFRVKHDVVPGHYDDIWFTATKPGRYHIFCAEYCGTEHSGMIGWVTAMEPTAFQNWVSGGGAEGSMASQGEKLFEQLGCSTCHLLDEQGRCPVLRGVYGSEVLLDDGNTVLADDAYIRESILQPNAKIVAGFHKDVMPTFQGQVTEENVLQLIEYVKSLSMKKTGVTSAEQTGQATGLERAGSAANAGEGRLQTEGTVMTTSPGRAEANHQATGNVPAPTGKKQ